MSIRLSCGFLVVFLCAAQTGLPKLEELDASLRADLRGDPQLSATPIDLPALSLDRPSSRSVSVTQLQHRPTKRAQQAMARGARFSRLGDHERAAAEFQQAIASDPAYASAHDRLGVEYQQLGRYSDSEAELHRSIGLDPNAWTAHYDLAVTLYRIGDLGAAEQRARRALELSRASPPVHLLLGLLMCRSEQTWEAGVSHLQYAAGAIPEAKELLEILKRSGLAVNPRKR